MDDEPVIDFDLCALSDKATGWTSGEIRDVLMFAASFVELARLNGIVADPGAVDVRCFLVSMADENLEELYQIHRARRVC